MAENVVSLVNNFMKGVVFIFNLLFHVVMSWNAGFGRLLCLLLESVAQCFPVPFKCYGHMALGSTYFHPPGMFLLPVCCQQQKLNFLRQWLLL